MPDELKTSITTTTDLDADGFPTTEIGWADWVNAWYRYGETHKEPWLVERKKCVEAMYDTEEKPQSDKLVWITVNLVASKIEKLIGRMIVNRPMPAVTGFGDEDEKAATIMQELHEWIVRRHQTELEFVACHRWQYNSGMGIGKEIFDPDLNDGLGDKSPRGPRGGDLSFQRVDDRIIVVDPKAKLPHCDNARFIIHPESDSLKAVEKEYPALEGKLGAEKDWEKADKKRILDGDADTDYSKGTAEGKVSPGKDPGGPEVLKKECWFPKSEKVTLVYIDGELQEGMTPEELPPGAEDTGYIEELPGSMGSEMQIPVTVPVGVPVAPEVMGLAPIGGQVPVLPELSPEPVRISVDVVRRTRVQWWVVTTCQGFVLEPAQESPYTHEHHPFIFFIHTPQEDTPWATGKVTTIRKLNNAYNVIMSLIMAAALRTQNSTTFVSGTVDAADVAKLAKMGIEEQVIRLGPNAKVWKMDASPLPPALPEVGDRIQIATEDVTSMPDVRHGKAPFSGASGILVQELTGESALAEVEVERYSETAYTRWLSLRIANIQQYMPLETAVRIIGEDGKPEWMPVNHEMAPDEEFPEKAQGEDATWTVTDRKNEDGSVSRILNDVGLAKFDLKYTVDSSKERTKAQRQQQMIELAQAGMVDTLTTLESLDIPNPQKIIERQDEKNQALQVGQQVLETPEMMELIQMVAETPDMIPKIIQALAKIEENPEGMVEGGQEEAQGPPQGAPSAPQGIGLPMGPGGNMGQI